MTTTLLVVADAFYPLTLAGAHRPAKLAKYLPELGIRPIVLCPEWTADNSGGFHDPLLGPEHDLCETIRVPTAGFPRGLLARAARKVEDALWPYHAPVALAASMRERALQVASARRIDAIWSTYVPGYPHVVASSLARARGIPWIADFRDLPDQTYRDARTSRIVELEVRTCATARALTATTEPLAARLASRHRAPVHVIPNGFDEDDYPPGEPASAPRFTIRYFGILYEFRDPRPMFAAIDRLVAEGTLPLDRVAVEFYGTDRGQVERLREGFSCAPSVVAKPRVGRAEMFELQRSATVLLNMQSGEAGGAVPSKLTEYLGARRPLLNLPGDGGAGDALVAATRTGVTVADVEGLTAVLRAWAEEWKADGTVRWRGDEAARARYTRRAQSASLARVLAEVIGGDARAARQVSEAVE